MAYLLPLLLIFSLLATCISTRPIKHTALSDYGVFSDLQVDNSSVPKRHVFAEDLSSNTALMSLGASIAHPSWVGVAIGFAVGITLGAVGFLLWRWVVKHCTRSDRCDALGTTTTTLFSPMVRIAEELSFLNDLNHDAHALPSPLEIIGRGGCGEVYKAELVTGERRIPIAIKKVVQPEPVVAIDAPRLSVEESGLLSHQLRQIRAEIRTVGRMRHPNLLRLLAHVSQPDCHYLVYEFMKNGSLHDVLKSRNRQLGWPARHKIALGIAAGLEYLHLVHRPRVIHRDLKPANILLDNNLNALITDFGLAKVVPDAIRISRATTSKVAGTLGYIAPEYYTKLSCTDKCDVYSFGVILAVLVTGRFPNDGFFQTVDEICIMGWVRRAMRSEDPSEAIDTVLLGQGFEEQMLLVLKIACLCTYDDPNQRPNSRDVRCMLTQIK